MGSSPVVFDISSDEEPGQEEFEDSEDANFPEPKADDFEWLSELIREAEEESDDSDVVVVVNEVNSNKQRSKSTPLNQSLDDLNDDCVILDGDPDKIVAFVNDSADDGDDLLVVGEKGQIPCRDYPHSRHLCAKFPFSSTPHEEHCDMCHCYVCDSIAPCLYWGTGVSTADHCHATDKGEMWKIQRKDLQLRKVVSLQAPKLLDSSVTTMGAQPNKVPSQNIVRLAPNSIARTSTPRLNAIMNARPQNQISRSTTIRPCSTSSNFAAPSILRKGRNQPSILARSRSHHRSFSHHPLGVLNNAIQRDRSLDISKLGSHFLPSIIRKRKIANRDNSPADRSIPHSSNGSCLSQHIVSLVTVGPLSVPGSNATNPSSWQDVQPDMNIDLYNNQSSLHPDMNVTNTMCSQVEVSHQHTSQSNDCESFYQNQNQCRDQNINQLGDFNQNANQNDSLLEIHSENGMIHVESNGQSVGASVFQLQTNSTAGPRSDVNINWVNDQSLENSQFVAENSQYQCVGSTYEPFPVQETTSHFTGEFNVNPLHGGSYENWPFENPTVPLLPDCSAPFESNMLSPERTAIDADSSVN